MVIEKSGQEECTGGGKSSSLFIKFWGVVWSAIVSTLIGWTEFWGDTGGEIFDGDDGGDAT